MSGSVEEFKKALGGEIVSGVSRPGALAVTEILGTRSWFDSQRYRLTSSGGRPTVPDWSLRRQIPFAPSTWQHLKDLADQWSEPGHRLAPGQVAALLLERVVQSAVNSGTERTSTRARSAVPSALRHGAQERRSEDWEMPPLFCRRAA